MISLYILAAIYHYHCFLLIYGILLKTRPFTADKKKEDTAAIKMIYSITSFLMASLVLVFGLNVYIELFLAWVIGRAALVIILLVMGLVIMSLMNEGAKE